MGITSRFMNNSKGRLIDSAYGIKAANGMDLS